MSLTWFNNFLFSRSGALLISGIATTTAAYLIYKALYKASEVEEPDEYFERTVTTNNENIPKRRILVVGLDGSGKTQFVSCLSKGKNIASLTSPKPTKGFNVKSICLGSTNFDIWDVGGAPEFRTYWKEFAKNIDVIVYVVDSADKDRLYEAKETLHGFMINQAVQEQPVLVIANKQDKEGSISGKQVLKSLAIDRAFRSKHKVECVEVQTPLGGTRKGIWKAYNLLKSM